MKLAKLSLAAIAVVGLTTSSFAADTLADAFKNGKVSGSLSAWYWDHDGGTAATDADITMLGLDVSYVTDSFNGFTAGATFQGTYSPFADTEAKTLHKNDAYGPGAVLSEAYVAYTMGKTTAKVGRQYISTPLVGGSGSRMTKESFEGAVVVNTDLPATTLIASYVTKFQARTDRVDSIGDFEKTAYFQGNTASSGLLAFDGAWTIAAINKSIPNLAITAQYAKILDVAGAMDVTVMFGELAYTMPMDNMKLGLNADYHKSSTSVTTDMEGDILGLKASVSGLGGFSGYAAYTTTDKSDATVYGMGNGPATYAALLIDGSGKTATADTTAYAIRLGYDFGAGLKALVQYNDISNDDSDTDYTVYAGEVSYAVAALKGLNLSLQYETLETDNGTTATDLDRLRFRADYKF